MSQVVIFMEQENIRIGKEKFFQGIFTTNANRHYRQPSLHAHKHPTNLKNDPTTHYLPHTHHPGWLRWSAELLATRYSRLFKLYFKRQTLTISSNKQFVSYTIQLTPSSQVTNLVCEKVNKYKDTSGNIPFASAPDDLVTEVASKSFEHSQF